jgi:hypothetical protein
LWFTRPEGPGPKPRPARGVAPGAEELRVNRSDVPRSILSVGMEWASRVTTVGLEFAVPPLLGALFDRWRGTSPVGVLTGVALGFALGMNHLLRFAREGTTSGPKPARRG